MWVMANVKWYIGWNEWGVVEESWPELMTLQELITLWWWQDSSYAYTINWWKVYDPNAVIEELNTYAVNYYNNFTSEWVLYNTGMPVNHDNMLLWAWYFDDWDPSQDVIYYNSQQQTWILEQLR